MNMNKYTFLLIFMCAIGKTFAKVYTEDHLVKISTGFVRGKVKYFPNDKSTVCYLAIPYAKPPIGNLRFKHPEPADSWNGVLDGSQFGFSCVQLPLSFSGLIPGYAQINPTTPFREDCLTLNVFVPRPSPKNSSVMVFIHGGGFSIWGTSLPFSDPAGLSAAENIIVVTMNYRLASLGFLNVDHPDVDKNCGLMDQLLSLKWIKSNIGHFGGNPEEVTLFGQSAGAISIGYHMMSPLSEGLFKRSILQSGTAQSLYTLQSKQENTNLAFETAKRLKCPDLRDTDAVVKCLKAANALDLVKKEHPKFGLPFQFKPVIDGSFLVANPTKLARTRQGFRKMEVMTGIVPNEGTVFLGFVVPMVFLPFFDKIEPYHEEFLQVVRILLKDECENFQRVVELLYTDWENFNSSSSNLKSSDELLVDYLFRCPQNLFLDLYTSIGAKTYSYYFNYRSPAVEYAKWLGILHSEELRYVMGEVSELDKYDEDEKLFAQRIMRYWANFARTGDPNISPKNNQVRDWITWPPYNHKHDVLILAPKTTKTITNYETNRCKFWRKSYLEIDEYTNTGKFICPDSITSHL